MIAVFGIALRNQGSAVILNFYFGPVLNSAFSIARQVSVQVNQLSGSMMQAIVPEIIVREGRSERDRMLQLAHQSCKYAFLLVLLFSVPLIVEMDYVLNLWLRTPPQHTAMLCRFLIISFLIGRLVAGYSAAVNASGKIAGFQISAGLALVLTLPSSWLLFHFGFGPVILGFAFLGTSFVYCIASIFWLRKLFSASALHWFEKVVLTLFVCGNRFIHRRILNFTLYGRIF